MGKKIKRVKKRVREAYERAHNEAKFHSEHQLYPDNLYTGIVTGLKIALDMIEEEETK